MKGGKRYNMRNKYSYICYGIIIALFCLSNNISYAHETEKQYIVEFTKDVALFDLRSESEPTVNVLTEDELKECIDAGIVEWYEEDYEVVYNATIPAEANPTKTGYTFSGWSAIPAKMPADNVTVTGTFSINQYTLKYMVDGVEYLSRTYDYNAVIGSEAEPEKADYVFDGWENLPVNMPAENVEVNAKWIRAYTASGVATFNGVAVAGITVEISGKTTSTDAAGNYSIEKLIPGSYTVNISKGVATENKAIVVEADNVTVESVDLKTLIDVINVSNSVKTVEDSANLFSDTDRSYVESADTNSVTYTITGDNVDFDGLANIADIKAAIPSGYKDTIHGVSVDVEKTMVGAETGTTAENALNGLIKITVELPEAMRSQSAYTVLRTDGTVVETLTTEANANGEKIEVSGNNIIIYAEKSGDYGVVYKQRTSSRGGSSSRRVATVKSNVSAKEEVLVGTTVELSTTTKDAEIYYTTDGTTPTDKSLKYDGPIVLTEDTTITAIAIKKGMTNSQSFKIAYKVRKAEVNLSADAQNTKYIDAYDDNSFKPDQAITRYEVVESLNNVFDIEKTNLKLEFSDVDDEYSELVDLFAGASIINGYEDKTFKGTRGITRGELVKILSVMLGIDTSNNDSSKFSDVEGHWAEGYINSFVELGYILGYPDGTFKPDNNITRSEFVIIVNRITKIQASTSKDCSDLSNKHWAYDEIMKAVK